MTIRTPSEAVAYATTRLNTGYNGYCLAHVQDAYGAEARYASAIAAWNGASVKHNTTNLAEAPYGAPIYFSQAGNPYGHIALHLTGDRMYTTDSGVGHPHEDSIAKWQTSYGYVPLGWSEDIENQMIPDILGDDDMALTDDDINRIWTHVLPNGACVRDCLSPAIQDIFRMHDTGLCDGEWLHVLPNGRVARDIISDATSDVIRIHDTMIPQLTAQVNALSEAVKTLAENSGADPDKIANIVENAVKTKLESLTITVE